MKSLLAVLHLETVRWIASCACGYVSHLIMRLLPVRLQWTRSDRQVQLLRTGLGLGLDSAPPEQGLPAKALWDAIAPITSDLGPRERV